MDIVERLRDVFSGNALKDISDQTQVYIKERYEAADEIERLQKALEEIAYRNPPSGEYDTDYTHHDLMGEIEVLKYIARLALGGDIKTHHKSYDPMKSSQSI